MISANACTWELDNPVAAAKELAAQISKQIPVLQKNSIGLIFGDAETDFNAISAELNQHFSFEILGGSSMGMLGVGEGYDEFCVTLLVLSADDCTFHVECSSPINKDNANTVISDACNKGLAAAGEKPKLVIAIAPRIGDVFIDIYPELIGELSGSVPVFGGIPSSTADNREFVFAKGNTYRDCAAFLFICGNLRPRFCTCNLFDNLVEQKRTITKAKDNIVYRVGNQTFVEYAQSLGLRFDFEDPDIRSFAFVTHPILVEENRAGTDGIPFVRTIGSVNMEEGYAVALGKIPEGALMSIGVLRKEEIVRSAKIGLESMQKLADTTDGYHYSTMFCISCIGRSMVMAPSIDLEGRLIQSSFGDKFCISGFYAWGEMCPTSYDDETANNRGHHETLSICAF